MTFPHKISGLPLKTFYWQAEIGGHACPRFVRVRVSVRVRDSKFCAIRVRVHVRGFKICDVRVRGHRRTSMSVDTSARVHRSH